MSPAESTKSTMNKCIHIDKRQMEENENKGQVNENKGQFNEKIEDLKEDIQEAAAKLDDKLDDIKEDVKEKIDDLKEDVKEAVKKADEKYGDKIDAAMEQESHTEEMPKEDIESGKLLSVLAYLGILILIPLFFNRSGNKFVKFHTSQAFTLALVELVCGAMERAHFLSFIAWIVSILCFILAVIGILNVIKGEAKELPVIGDYTILK